MSISKQRVLILDDDPEQLLLVGRTLRAAGYDVEMVTSPIGITNVARRLQPDIVMLEALSTSSAEKVRARPTRKDYGTVPRPELSPL